MSIDLLGLWRGSYHTDGLWYDPDVFNLQGGYEGNIGHGGPAQNLDVSLEVKWQGDYETHYYALVVSPFYGDLVGVQQDSIPVSGFINPQGFI